MSEDQEQKPNLKPPKMFEFEANVFRTGWIESVREGFQEVKLLIRDTNKDLKELKDEFHRLDRQIVALQVKLGVYSAGIAAGATVTINIILFLLNK